VPVGPYKTFGACVAAQKRKGKSKKSAGAICGEIEKRTKKKNELKLALGRKSLEIHEIVDEMILRRQTLLTSQAERGEV
jgi:hypothetical protein